MRPLSMRRTGVAAIVCGGSLIAAEVTLLLVRDTDHWDCASASDLWVNALYLVAFVLIAPAVLGIHRIQRGSAPRWSAFAGRAAAGAAVTTGLVNAAEHCLHLPIGILFVAGALASVLALGAFGIGTFRAGVLPGWMGLAILAGSAALQILSQQGGPYLFGSAWIAVGAGLLAHAGDPAHAPQSSF